MIEQYQTVRLKDGRRACIVEVLEQEKAYIADIEISKDEFETDQITQGDIVGVYIEVEVPV